MRGLYSSKLSYTTQKMRYFSTNLPLLATRQTSSGSTNNIIRLLVVGLNNIEGLITAYSLNHFQHHPDYKAYNESALRKNNFKFQVDILEPKRDTAMATAQPLMGTSSFTQEENLEKALEGQAVVLNPCSTKILQQLHLLDDLIRDADGLVLDGEVVRSQAGSVILHQDFKQDSEQKYKSLPFVSFEKKKLVRVC